MGFWPRSPRGISGGILWRRATRSVRRGESIMGNKILILDNVFYCSLSFPHASHQDQLEHDGLLRCSRDRSARAAATFTCEGKSFEFVDGCGAQAARRPTDVTTKRWRFPARSQAWRSATTTSGPMKPPVPAAQHIPDASSWKGGYTSRLLTRCTVKSAPQRQIFSAAFSSCSEQRQ